jgi:hypothetical protein
MPIFSGVTISGGIGITVAPPPPPPTAFGQAYGGGIYMGTVNVSGTCYYLIVAPNSTGCAACQWKTTRTTTDSSCSCVDGYNNTYGPQNNNTHPAGNWCATRTINGFSDWYLPARNELQTIYNNGANGNNQSVIGVGEAFAAGPYWSSSECDSTRSWRLFFSFGEAGPHPKTYTNSIRAVRRVPI